MGQRTDFKKGGTKAEGPLSVFPEMKLAIPEMWQWQ